MGTRNDIPSYVFLLTSKTSSFFPLQSSFITAVRQRAGTEQYVPTSAVHPAPSSSGIMRKTSYIDNFFPIPSYICHQNMFDEDRFHNALALSLGYERIVKDKRITIEVEESDDPCVTLKFQGSPELVRFNASGKANAVETGIESEVKNEVKVIVDAVHQAYIEATTNPFEMSRDTI